MKGITIGGVEYLPASALAKQFKYTTDYIGQLCRAKKVDAQLVGRSWYVNPVSLTAHKEGRYANVKAVGKIEVHETKQEEKGYKVKLSRLDVEPVITKNAGKLPQEKESNKNFAKRIDWKPLKYEVDDTALLPQLRPMTPARRVQVDLADSTEITIKTSTKPTNLVAEDLPTVALKGDLRVESLDETETFEEESTELPAIPEPATQQREQRSVLHHAPLPKMPLTRREPLRRAPKPLVRPELIVPSVKEEESEAVEAVSKTSYAEAALGAICILLTCLILVLVFAESSTQASAGIFSSKLNFSLDSLTTLQALFSR